MNQAIKKNVILDKRNPSTAKNCEFDSQIKQLEYSEDISVFCPSCRVRFTANTILVELGNSNSLRLGYRHHLLLE